MVVGWHYRRFGHTIKRCLKAELLKTGAIVGCNMAGVKWD